MSSRWWGAVKLWRMLVGSLDDENEKNAAAERPATAAKTPLGLGSEPVWWSASGFRSICIPQVLEVGGMGAALGAHRVSTAVANPPALIK